MTDGQKDPEGSRAVPSTQGGGKLPRVRRRGSKRDDEVHPVRTESGEELPGMEGTPRSVGDRVTMTGEVVCVSTVGGSWVVVRLDGPREHTVACWLTDLKAP